MFFNVILVGLVTLIVKSVGFLKEMEVGRTFGLSEVIDTFFMASLVPGFVNNVFMSSFQNIFIPNYIMEMRQGKDISSFYSTCVIFTFCMALVLSFIAYWFTDFFIEDLFSGHSAEYYHLIRIQFYILLPCIFFWSFSSLLSGVLEINGLFRFSTIYPIITSLVYLVNIYFFQNKMGWLLLSISMLLGSFLEFVYLLFISIYKNTTKLSKPDFRSDNVIILFKQIPSKVGSSFLTGSTGFVNQFFAAQLMVGSLSAFNYGQKIPSFLVTILIIALGNVLLPYFSNLAYDNRTKAYEVVNKSIIYTFLFSLLFIGILFIFSENIVSVLFEKGNFTSNDTIRVARIQQILLIYIPFYVSSIIIIKFLTSINKNNYMFYASVLNLVLNVILNVYFVKFYEINGLALATAIVYIVNFGVLFVFFRYQKKMDSA